MGLVNPRVRCPNCRNKIAIFRDYSVIGTSEQPHGGLSRKRTPPQCPSCGALLTGNVVHGQAELAPPPVEETTA